MSASAALRFGRLHWHRWRAIVLHLLMGSVLVLVVYNHMLRRPPLHILGNEAVFFLACVFGGAGLVSILGERLIWPAFRSLLLGTQMFLLGWSLLTAGLVLFILPAQVPAPSRLHQLEITVAGEKNFFALNNEVWVNRLVLPNGLSVSFDDMEQQGSWSTEHAMLRAVAPATLRWQGVVGDDMQLHLAALPWAGKAQVRWDSQISTTVDLYANPPHEEVITLPGATIPFGQSQRSWYQMASLLADTLALALLLGSVGLLGAVRWGSRYRWVCNSVGVRWWVLPLLIPISLTLVQVLTPILLEGGAFKHRLKPADRVWVWGYSLLLLTTVGALLARSLRPTMMPAWPPALHWLERRWRGQSIWAWLVAVAGLALIAGVGARQASSLGQQAVWFKVVLDSASARPPAAVVRYGDEPGAGQPLMWQPSAETNVAVRPLTSGALVQVQSLTTEAGPLALDGVTGAAGVAGAGGMVITDTAGALLSWPAANGAITMTLTGAGDAELRWFDQVRRVTLGAEPVQVPFKLAGQYQGWALLPPRSLLGLRLELPSADPTYQIRQWDIFSDPRQHWDAQTPGGAWGTEGCANSHQATGVALTMTGQLCTVHLPDIRPVSSAGWGRGVVVWMALLLGSLAGLVGLTWVAQRFPHRADVGIAAWLGTRQRTLDRRAWVVVGLVGLLALGWHIAFVLAVPMSDTPDSFGYYGPAVKLTQSLRLSLVDTGRTPGYPLIIAGAILLLGNTNASIILVNHLLLALLAPLTVWSLTRRKNLFVGAIAGLSVVALPVNSIYANVLMSDASFGALITAALLVYLAYEAQWRGLVVAGAFVGAATMVRPNGLLLLAILIGCLLLRAWWSVGNTTRQWFALRASAALLLGYVVIAAPWHMHLWLVRDSADLSEGLAGFAKWAGSAYQGLIRADFLVNQPEQALWSVAWRADPYGLIARAPQTVGGYVGDGNIYYDSAFRELTHNHTRLWLNQVALAFVYNVTFIPLQPQHMYYWPQASDIGRAWYESDVRPPPLPEAASVAVRSLYTWQPLLLSLRKPMLGMGLMLLAHWVWLAGVSLCCISVLVATPALRSFIIGWLFWLSVAGTISFITMPVERYVMVIEPVLYILITVTLCTLVQLGYHRVLARTQRSYVPARPPVA